MQLKLSEQKSQSQFQRPICLSLDFFASLMLTQAKRSGIFQILSFTRKREGVYSTKINDGFFVVKTMLVGEAARQIQQGLIKNYYLLRGNIRNHGEGVVVIKEKLQIWQFGKQVGSPLPWRLKKQNINSKGSNYIIWSTQKLEGLLSNTSQIMIDYGIKIQFSSDDKFNHSSQDKLKSNNVLLCQKRAESQEQIQATQSMSNESMETITPQDRFKTILQFILTDSSENDSEISQQDKLIKNQKKPYYNSSRKKLSQRKSDLEFIFNCLSQDELKNQENNNIHLIPDQILNSSSQNSSYDLSDWIELKKQQKRLKQDHSKIKSNIQKQGFISFQDLYNGFITDFNNYFTKVRVKCQSKEGNIIKSIICDSQNQYFIYATFFNVGLEDQLIEDQGYKIGKGLIKFPIILKLKCPVQLQFDYQTCLLQPIQLISVPNESSQNYTSIAKIHESIDEGETVNCFGIIKSFKSFKGKNSSSIHYQLVDPISKWSIFYVIFQSKIQIDQIKKYINLPLTIFSAAVGSYKSKKNLVCKPFTIIQYQKLPKAVQAIQIQCWLKENISVLSLETELVGYRQIVDLQELESEPNGHYFINKAIVFEFNNKFTYKACKSCFKKVEDGRCRLCGPRIQEQIVDRLFLRGSVGDSSTTLKIIWSNDYAQKLMYEGFEQMRKIWILNNVSLWIEKGNNGSISIVRMQKKILKNEIISCLSFIKNNIQTNSK